MDWNSKENRKFVETILSLRTTDEARRFLRDLLTETEIKEFAKRIRAAELLSKGVMYSAIEEETGLSSRTIARVSKFLKGKEMGYKKIINRLHHHNSVQARRGLS
jgi:TrpR-related protein YerC/YecD